MRKLFRLLLLLSLLLGSPAALPASADQTGAVPTAAAPRMVVFEGFYNLT